MSTSTRGELGSALKSSLSLIRQGLSCQIFAKLKQEIETLVDRILAAKQADPTADVQSLETRIDQLVYQLYNLTPEEISIVEGVPPNESNQ